MSRQVVSRSFINNAKNRGNPSTILLLSFAVLAMGLFALFVLCSNSVASGSKTKDAQTAQTASCPTCAPPTEQIIYAPTIGLPELTRSQVVFNNRSPRIKETIPTFYTTDGLAIVGQPVQLQPAEIRFVDIQTLIPPDQIGKHTWGGMSLSYTGNNREVWAQLTLKNPTGEGTASADVFFFVLGEQVSDTQEGVWWMPQRSLSVLALGNVSTQSVHASLQYANGDVQNTIIAPHGTSYVRRIMGINAPTDGVVESVKITSTGSPGALRMTGVTASADKRFTSTIRFYDPQHTVQQNLYASNLRLKNTAPHMVLKNTSDSQINARPRFLPFSGERGAPVELPVVSLQPHESVAVDLRQLMSTASNRFDFDSVSAEVLSDGRAGGLIGSLYSVDRSSGAAYDVPLRDTGALRNLTGAYPWRLDGDYSTIVTITNVDLNPAQFTVNIFYEGGKYELNPQDLVAGETAVFNLKKIRDEQKPDRMGNVIPRTINMGQFRWSVYGENGASAKLTGRAEMVSIMGRVSSSYSCPTCCPNSFYDGSFFPNGIDTYVDGSFLVNTQQRQRDCYNNIYGPYDASPNMGWSVTDSSITSVSQTNTGQATVSGLAGGSTSIFAYFTGPSYTDGGQGYCYVTTGYSSPSGSVLVKRRSHNILHRTVDFGDGSCGYNEIANCNTSCPVHTLLSRCANGEYIDAVVSFTPQECDYDRVLVVPNTPNRNCFDR